MKNALILGYGITGKSAERWLCAHGYRVSIHDDQQKRFECPALETLDYLVKSPGVPDNHSLVQECKARSIKIVSDLDFFTPQAQVIGVTGTNGKSTVVALLRDILQACGKPVAAGGNFGTPCLDLPELPADGFYILELSSYQLSLPLPFPLAIAAWTNISYDHLGYHGTMEAYVAAKTNIFRTAKHAVICDNDAYSHDVITSLTTPASIVNNRTIQDDQLFMDGTAVLNLKDCGLRGKHNYLNIALAWRIAKHLGCDDSKINQSCLSFQSLPHRLQLVKYSENISYFNDSKSTNIDATIKAIEAFEGEGDIYLILGGKLKCPEDLVPLKAMMNKVKAIYGLGEVAHTALHVHDIPLTLHERLEDVLAHIHRDIALASSQSIVLFSPGGSSFDQYENFEKRGEHFMSHLALHPSSSPRTPR